MATADEYASWIVKNADKKGTPDFEVVAKAYQDAKAGGSTEAPSKPFGKMLDEGIADIPRQVGLTVRHGIKALGNTVGLLSDPIGAVINTATGSNLKPAGSMAGMISDSIGLPKPANATERTVGDATEMMATGGGFAGAARKAAGALSGMGGTVAQGMAANPLGQVVSGGAAGGAGGYTRETGGGNTAQMVAALTAGVAAPAALGKAQQVGAAGNKLLQRAIAPPVPPEQAAQIIDIKITNALQNSGMTIDDVPKNILAGMREDVAQAMNTNSQLSPDAVRRLADYRMTGATPTGATLTLDPAAISQQKNLAKLGINSKDVTAQRLGMVENANNRQLIGGLNDLGAGTADSALAGGNKIMGALAARNDRAKALIDGRYAQARATDGRSAALDPSHFANSANDALDAALLGGKLPSDVRNLLNNAATGKMPLTVDTAEQFKTRIGELQRASSDMAERKALGLVRQSLDATPLLDGQGRAAIDAFSKARKLNAAYMGIVEKTPALQAVRDGIEPDKFVQKFIVGSGEKANLSDLAALRQSIKSSPEAMQAVRGQIAAYLKNKALNGAADEVGNLSQSALNKAMDGIGNDKLSMFFPREDVLKLRAIGRVASYEQVQPRGAAVNNSNTAGTAIANILDRVGSSSILSKIPLGNLLSAPAQNISVGMRSADALKVPNALITRLPAPQSNALMLSPAAFLSGRKDERKNSLLP